MDILVHHLLELLLALDPSVVDGVGEPSEDVVLVLHPARKRCVDLLVARVVINEVEHVNVAPGLAKPLDATEALLESRWVPRKIDVDESAERLKVQPFASSIGGYHEAKFTALHRLLDLLALDSGELAIAQQTALADARVDCERLVRQILRELLPD